MNNYRQEPSLENFARQLRALRAAPPQPESQQVLSMEAYCYYADLLDYTKNVLTLKNNAPLNAKSLEKRFFQPFGDDLLLWEKAESDEVHQVRLCIESLRQCFLDSEYKPADNTAQQNLEKEEKRYLQNVHRALLEKIGTSYNELRDALNETPQVREELANRLGFDLNSDRLEQLLLAKVDPSEIEQKLEELFGLRDTRRIGYSNGAIKLVPKTLIDSMPDLRWFFEGVHWNINTDQDGCIYLSSEVDANGVQEIKIFRDATKQKQDLVASGKLESERVILKAEKSGLRGALFGVDTAKIQNATISFALIPKLVCWRLEYLRKLWHQQDWPEDVYQNLNLPTIDPDLIGPEDFRAPVSAKDLGNQPNAFDIWMGRRSWLDERLEDFACCTKQVSGSNGETITVPDIDGMFKLMSVSVHYKGVNDITTPVTAWKQGVEAKFGSLQEQLSRDSQSHANAQKEIETELHLTIASFVRLMTLRSQASHNQMSADDWAEVHSILTQALKVSLFKGWRQEEKDLKVTLGPKTFWHPYQEPTIGHWIPIRKTDGLIDPAQVELEDLCDGDVGADVRQLWQERRQWLDQQEAELKRLRSEGGIAAIVQKAYESAPGSKCPCDWTELNKLYSLAITPLNEDDPLLNNAKKVIQDTLKIPSIKQFCTMIELYQRKNAGETLSEGEWRFLESLFAQVRRRLLPANELWEDVEGKQNGITKWWQVYRHHLPKWRASADQRQLWVQSLNINSRTPIIDPDIVPNPYVKPSEQPVEHWFNSVTESLWNPRSKQSKDFGLNQQTSPNELDEILVNNLISSDVINDVQKRFPNQATAKLHGKLWDLPDYENGFQAKRLNQLGLSIDQYDCLRRLRMSLESGLNFTEDDLAEIRTILWIATKSHIEYEEWLNEEKSSKPPILLSSDFFTLPEEGDVSANGNGATPLMNKEFQAWKQKLLNRIDQEQNLMRAMRSSVSSVEEVTLSSLRDAMIYAANIAGIPQDVSNDKTKLFLYKASWLSERLQIDCQANANQVTDRTAFAIETLQGLLWSMRNGLLADKQLDIAGSSSKDFKFDRDFDNDWQWLGSYSNWLAAMQVFLYPENVLRPRLKEWHTQAFQHLVEELENRKPVSPEDVRNIAKGYAEYLQDICSLKHEVGIQVEEFYYLFARSTCSRKVYWRKVRLSGKDPVDPSALDLTKESFPGFWKELPEDKVAAMKNVVALIGAVQYHGIIYLFAQGEDWSRDKLLFALYDPVSDNWTTEGNNYINFPEDAAKFREIRLYETSNEDPPRLGVWFSDGRIFLVQFNRQCFVGAVQKIELPTNQTRTDLEKKWSGCQEFCSFKNYEDSGACNRFILIDNKTLFQNKNLLSYSLSPSTDTKRLVPTDQDNDSPIGHYQLRNYNSFSDDFVEGSIPNGLRNCNYPPPGLPTPGFHGGNVEIRVDVSFLALTPINLGTSTHLIAVCGISVLTSKPPYFWLYRMSGELQPDGSFKDDWKPWYLIPSELFPFNKFALPAHISATADDLNEDGVPELVIFYARRGGTRDFGNCDGYYIVGSKLNITTGEFTTWSPQPNQIPGSFGFINHGIGVATGKFTNTVLGKENIKDLIVFWIEHPHEGDGNSGYYQVGWGISPQDFTIERGWSERIPVPGWFGANNGGAGIGLTYLDSNINPELLVFHLDNYPGDGDQNPPSHNGYFRVGWNVGTFLEDEQQPSGKVSNVVPVYGGPYDITEQRSFADQDLWRQRTEDTLNANDAVLANQIYFEEAWYFVPTQIALALQESGLYTAAIDWLRVAYDDRFPANQRKIYYGLKEEETGNFVRNKDWWRTLNPHEIANPPNALNNRRKNAYTRFTLLTLVQCLLDYADEEFTHETSESINQARLLYQNTLDLLSLLSSEDLQSSSSIPLNPILDSFRSHVSLNLQKLEKDLNITGMVRQTPRYTLPDNLATAAQQVAEGVPLAEYNSNEPPPVYRFDYLIRYAKEYVAAAANLEKTMLQAFTQSDAEQYNLLKARQDLGIAQANITLQDFKVKESQDNYILSTIQTKRAEFQRDHFVELLRKPLSEKEEISIKSFWESYNLGIVAGELGAANSGFQAGSSAASSGAPAWAAVVLGIGVGAAGQVNATSEMLGKLSQGRAMQASFERRSQEWEFQRGLAQQDIEIAQTNEFLAQDRQAIATQEHVIAQLQQEYTAEVINFLGAKFTGKPLWDWMGSVVRGYHRTHINFATVMARMAQQALAFERQEPLNFIASYYANPKKRDLEIADQLATDIASLEKYRTTTEKRRKELTKVISLGSLAPIEFQQMRQTGWMTFATLMDWFDRDFPGHYMRLIKSVSVTIVGLVPPGESIHATLSNNGLSKVMVGEPFKAMKTIHRQPESIAVSAASNGTGLFEMLPSDPMLFPFEGSGVQAMWTLEMPKGANRFDFSTLIDVVLTIRYTALEDTSYRDQVLNQLKSADGKIHTQSMSSLSLRTAFPDEWYHLLNPISPSDTKEGRAIEFSLTSGDFPPNEEVQKILRLTLALSQEHFVEVPIEIEFESQEKVAGDLTYLYRVETNYRWNPAKPQTGPISFTAFTHRRLASTPDDFWEATDTVFANADLRPFGKWTIRIQNNSLKEQDLSWLNDALFVVTYDATVEYGYA